MKKKKIKPITKARNLETTKKDMVFYRTPFFFRAFVPRRINGGQASCFRDEPLNFILYSVSCLLYSFFIPLVSNFRHFSSL